METEGTLRVVRTTKCGGKTDEEVIWAGTSIDDLSMAYPPSDVLGADRLEDYKADDDLVVVTFTFEQRTSERDEWVQIDDPRRRLTPVTVTERAIDRENRRFFPGDYVTSEGCEHCGDPECDGDCKANPTVDYGE